MQEQLMLKIDNVSKRYKLGQIGGTTLRDELQRKRAKRKGLEDPTSRIGAKKVAVGEEFYALSNVSFEVKKGERVGIIGHNGAGKSTLLKLISRVTAPTDGTISMNGRVASMLEVGTGFHGELTGRENIYMNGAILGMTTKEIDSKIEDIIEFSECRDFIDTPVKRYSSGMYVKLAFSVAAHLDSEIMIMDEVLAVGDMAFQKKCLDKMNDVSRQDGRTILYVSHNMSTIRQLCDRVIVLDHGQVIFNGDVEKGISIYLGINSVISNHYEYTKQHHKNLHSSDKFVIKSLDIEKDDELVNSGDIVNMKLAYTSKEDYKNVLMRIVFICKNGQQKATSFSCSSIDCSKGDHSISIKLDTSNLVNGSYEGDIILFKYNEYGSEEVIDGVYPGFGLEIANNITSNNKIIWKSQYWGTYRINDIDIIHNR